VPAPLSIYEGINKLKAAHTLTLEDGRVEEERYWRLSYQKPTPSPVNQRPLNICASCSPIRSVCVWCPMCRSVFLLSGGVDSSAVTALAVQAASETVKTFSISFAESSFDESSYARAVAKFLNTDHHEERSVPNLAANLVGEIGSWMDEPNSDPSLVADLFVVSLHAQARDGGAGRRRW